MALPPFEFPHYDSSLNTRVSTTLVGPRDAVYAMHLSPDGKFLALGNDGGSLEVRSTLFMQVSRSVLIEVLYTRFARQSQAGKEYESMKKGPIFGLYLGIHQKKGRSSLDVATEISTD